MIARRDAKARMTVDDARRLRRNRNIREQSPDESRTHGRSVHRRDDRLAAVDHVVDEIACLAPYARAHVEVVRHLFDEAEIAARRKALALAANHRDARL